MSLLNCFYVAIFIRGCRDIILRLLHKDDWRRLGSKTGASEVKQHRWFATLKWGLLRNEQPPIRPTVHKDGVGVNVRHMKESVSLDLEGSGTSTPVDAQAKQQRMLKDGSRGRSRKELPTGAAWTSAPGVPDPFSGFSSVTLHYDGEN